MDNHVLQVISIPADDVVGLVLYLTIDGGFYHKHEPSEKNVSSRWKFSFEDNLKFPRSRSPLISNFGGEDARVLFLKNFDEEDRSIIGRFEGL